MELNNTVIQILYLIASALFILSLRWMSSPATARRGLAMIQDRIRHGFRNTGLA